MLILDASNIIHSGCNTGIVYPCGSDFSKQLKGIPYLFSKVANFAVKNANLVVAFDPDKTGKFNGTSQFETHRVHNPQVVWELRVLKRLLDYIGTPAIEMPGVKADHIIYNLCEQGVSMKEDHYLVSADSDITCNVRARGKYRTSVLGYNVHSYNVNYENFHAVTGVPYNFVNINKLLLGCSGDGIPVYKNGRKLWSSFLEHLDFMVTMGSGGEYESHLDFELVYDTFAYNTEEYFFEWLLDIEGVKEDEEELRMRASHIFSKKCHLEITTKQDWLKWNALSNLLFRDASLQFIQKGAADFSDNDINMIHAILETTPLVASTVFSPNTSIREEASSEDLSDLLVFEKGDDNGL